MNEPTLPASLDAEESVLGTILVKGEAIDRVIEIIEPRDFFRQAHRRIFEAMKRLSEDKGTSVDFITLKEELQRAGHLDDVGGPAYVSSLAKGVASSTNIEHYARIVKEKARLRGIIETGNKMVANAYKAEQESAEILHTADRQLLTLQSDRQSDLVDISTTGAALRERLNERLQRKGEVTGVATGYTSIDHETLGWQPSDLIIVGARPSIGKTMFALNTAVAVAKNEDHVVAIFSLEMKRVRLEDRILAHIAQVDAMAIRSGLLTREDCTELASAIEVMSRLHIHVDESPGLTAESIRHSCRRLKLEGRLDLVIVDYVQLMASTAAKGANRNEQITDASRRLKNLAAECDVPILLMSQLSRANDKRPDPRPRLSDLRESGALEQDADIVSFLHRANHKQDGATAFIIEKQRDGPTGEVNLTLSRDTQTFTDGGIAPEPEPQAPKTKKPRKMT